MEQFNIDRSVVGQISDNGTNNIQIGQIKRRTFRDHLFSWYGMLGTTATIIFGVLGWYALHIQLGWWFLWL